MSGPVEPTLSQVEPQSTGQLPPEADPGTDNFTDPVEPPQDSPGGETDWKKRYDDSRRGMQSFQQQTRAELEQIRQRAEAAEQQSQMLQFQLMQSMQQRAPVVTSQPQQQAEFLSAAEAKELADAQLEGNATKAAEIQNRALNRSVQQIQSQQQYQQQASAAVMADLTRVQQLVPEFGKDRNISQQLLMQAQQLKWQNPYLSDSVALREVATDYVLSKHRAVNTAQERARVGADTRVGEPASPSGKATPGDQKPQAFNQNTHLFPGEREYVDQQRQRDSSYTYARYFNNLPPEVKEARLRAGKPLKRNQI